MRPSRSPLFVGILLAATLVLVSCAMLPPTEATVPTTAAPTPAVSLTDPPSPSPTPSPSPSPAPTPSPFPTPLLPPDDKALAYFGPLPIPAGSKPVQRSEVKGLYIGEGGNIVSNLAVAQAMEVNALVIDLKESDGIYYNCSVPLALEIGAVKSYYKLEDMVAKCRAAGVRLIGRIVCFKDKPLAAAKPEWCIRDASGKKLTFSNEGGLPFISAYSQDAWEYNIAIALDAIRLGIDEIQFDYVRFPTGSARGGKPFYGPPETTPDKIAAINRFLQTAAIRIQVEQGIPLGADVFAIVLTNTSDSPGLGQEWATVGLTGIDSVSPMIYPSHYANSSTGHYTGNGVGTYINGVIYPKPDLEPYAVMYNVLAVARGSASQTGFAACRPWLQAFTASYLPEGYYQTYGSKEIKAQIKAITDAGFREWICWNPAATYSQSAFAPEG